MLEEYPISDNLNNPRIRCRGNLRMIKTNYSLAKKQLIQQTVRQECFLKKFQKEELFADCWFLPVYRDPYNCVLINRCHVEELFA